VAVVVVVSTRLPVLWFGLVNACLPLPCRVAHAAGHMAACRGALDRHRPGLARSNRVVWCFVGDDGLARKG
jgi:hypothetical protein